MRGFLSFLHVALLGALFQQGSHWKESPVPLVPCLYPQRRLESILCYVQQCGGIKGRNQSLLVTGDSLSCQKQPA